MSSGYRALIVLLGLAAAAGAPAPGRGPGGAPPALAWCRGEKPESVLDCLADAYESGDSVALGQILADDYQYCFLRESNAFDRAEEYAAACRLLREATDVQFILGDPPVVSPGQEPGTWILSGAAPVVTLNLEREGQPLHLETPPGKAKFWVRRVMKPRPHLVIFRYLFTDSTGTE